MSESRLCDIDTIAYYNANAAEYAKVTRSADMSSILAAFTGMLEPGARVLDWGCGCGRDSRALADSGFAVVSTDASEALCDQASRLFGIKACCEAFADLAEREAFDGIWASASLLHLSMAELPEAIAIAHRALKPGGVFYASFKLGSFEGERDGRWYTDLDEPALLGLLDPLFEARRLWTSDDVRSDFQENKWLNCLATKRS